MAILSQPILGSDVDYNSPLKTDKIVLISIQEAARLMKAPTSEVERQVEVEGYATKIMFGKTLYKKSDIEALVANAAA